MGRVDRCFGLLEEMTDLHQFLDVGEIFARRRMDDNRLAVAGELQVAVVLLRRRGHGCEHGADIAPLKVSGDRVLKDGVVRGRMSS